MSCPVYARLRRAANAQVPALQGCQNRGVPLLPRPKASTYPPLVCLCRACSLRPGTRQGTRTPYPTLSTICHQGPVLNQTDYLAKYRFHCHRRLVIGVAAHCIAPTLVAPCLGPPLLVLVFTPTYGRLALSCPHTPPPTHGSGGATYVVTRLLVWHQPTHEGPLGLTTTPGSGSWGDYRRDATYVCLFFFPRALSHQ